MSPEPDFLCHSCDQRHPGPPLSYGSPAPDYWSPETAADPLSVLDAETCVIQGSAFFVRGLIEIPVHGGDEPLTWNVWVSLSKENFARAVALWERPERATEPPYFGWLSTTITAYPVPTLNLKTNLHTRPVGERPLIELEPTDHPLAVEQRTGVTPARVRQIAEALLHG